MSDLDREKIERCKKVLLKDYFDASIVEMAVNVVDFAEKTHKHLEFLKFGKWVYIPREWFTDPANIPDYVFSQFGRELALGEKNYIVQEILKNDEITTKRIQKFNYESLVNTLHGLRARTDSPILFAPNEYYVPIHVDWSRELGRLLVEKKHLLIDNTRVRVFWSSKYVDFDEVIVGRMTFGRWVAKPTVRDRLKVDVLESEKEPDKLELKVQTVFNFTIPNPDHIEVLRVPKKSRAKERGSAQKK